jgi:hypothetical protein
VSPADDPEAFEAWYRTIVGSDDVEDLECNHAMERWMRSLFAARGPVTTDEAEVAYRTHMLEVARADVEIVRRDVERTTEWRPTIEIDEYAETVRIALDSGWSTPAFDNCENPAALVEIADYLQDHVIHELQGAWPLCGAHGFGAHPELRDGTAVWWCRHPGHVVAEIGDLHQ